MAQDLPGRVDLLPGVVVVDTEGLHVGPNTIDAVNPTKELREGKSVECHLRSRRAVSLGVGECQELRLPLEPRGMETIVEDEESLRRRDRKSDHGKVTVYASVEGRNAGRCGFGRNV